MDALDALKNFVLGAHKRHIAFPGSCPRHPPCSLAEQAVNARRYGRKMDAV
jgi:hypothetical protein